jgi:hypothetical protein
MDAAFCLLFRGTVPHHFYLRREVSGHGRKPAPARL